MFLGPGTGISPGSGFGGHILCHQTSAILLAVTPSSHLEGMFPPTEVANKFSALFPHEQRLLTAHPQSYSNSIWGSDSKALGLGLAGQTPLSSTPAAQRLLTDSLPPCLCCQAMATGLLPAQPPLLRTLSPTFPLLASQHSQLNLHHPQSLGLGVVFICLLVHNLSELFTLLPPLTPVPFPRSCARTGGFCRPLPAEVTAAQWGCAQSPSCHSCPQPGVPYGGHEPRVCGSLTLLKGTYRPISCYTIALHSQAVGPRAFAQINRVWN